MYKNYKADNFKSNYNLPLNYEINKKDNLENKKINSNDYDTIKKIVLDKKEIVREFPNKNRKLKK